MLHFIANVMCFNEERDFLQKILMLLSLLKQNTGHVGCLKNKEGNKKRKLNSHKFKQTKCIYLNDPRFYMFCFWKQFPKND